MRDHNLAAFFFQGMGGITSASWQEAADLQSSGKTCCDMALRRILEW